MTKISFEDLDFSSSEEKFLVKNQQWCRAFINLLEGADPEDRSKLIGTWFDDPTSEYYSLVGFKHEDGRWDVIPLPVFKKIFASALGGISDERATRRRKIAVRFNMSVRPLAEYEKEADIYASNNERLLPLGSSGMPREEIPTSLRVLEHIRRDMFGCSAVVTAERMEEVVSLPWAEQVPAYMAAVLTAYMNPEVEWNQIPPGIPYIYGCTVRYTTNSGSTHLEASPWGFTASRERGCGSLSRSHPGIYKLAGGQSYPGHEVV